MEKKSKRKKIKHEKRPSIPAEGKRDDDDAASEIDFGGIPKRDLKKNLGCG
jgi:hypothetical protein